MTPSLQDAINLARSGNKDRARALLIPIIQQDPQNETAWLWFVDCLNNDTQRIEALERFLKIKPDSEQAAKALGILRSQQAAPPTPPEQKPAIPPPVKQPEVIYPTTGNIDPVFLQEMVDQSVPPAADPQPPAPRSPMASAPVFLPENQPTPPEMIASASTSADQPPAFDPHALTAPAKRSYSVIRWLAIILMFIFVILLIFTANQMGFFSLKGPQIGAAPTSTSNSSSSIPVDLATLSSLSFSSTQTAAPRATREALTRPTITPSPRPPLPTFNPGSSGGIGFYPSVDLPDMRSQHTTTLLQDGKVLLVGGSSSNAASSSNYLFNPSDQTWTQVDSLTEARIGHRAVYTANGQVLVVGGKNEQGDVKSAESFDPATNAWTITVPFYKHGTGHMAVALNNGLVLVAGGCTSNGPTDAAELYDPGNHSWIKISPLPQKRCGGTAVMLANDNRALIIGGTQNAEDPSVLIYDILDETWTPAASLIEPRSFHTATQLLDNRVIVTGGLSLDGTPLASAEVYNPVNNSWINLAPMPQPRYNHTAILAPDTRLVLIGGEQKPKDKTAPPTYFDTADVYFGGSNLWSPPVKMDTPLANFATVDLLDGRTFISGGTTDGKQELFTSIMMVEYYDNN